MHAGDCRMLSAPFTPKFTTLEPMGVETVVTPKVRNEKSTFKPTIGASYELFRMVARISYSVLGSSSPSETWTPFLKRATSGLSQVTARPRLRRYF
jgi:hypothetical protein